MRSFVKKIKTGVFRKFFADELIESAYRGVLGRDPDPEGIREYRKALEHGDLASMLSALKASGESRSRDLAALMPDLVKAMFKGILGREPEPEALAAYSKDLAATGDLSAIISDVRHSSEFRHENFVSLAPEMVRATFKGILGREPEPEDLAAYSKELAATEDLSATIAKIRHSSEFRHENFVSLAPEMVRATFKGILGREPEPAVLASCCEDLAEKGDLAGLMEEVSHCSEFWEKENALLAADLVKALFQGILEREPEPEALAAYIKELAEKGNLAAIVSDISHSEESMGKNFQALVPEMLSAVFRGLLGREIDPFGLIDYSSKLASPGDLTKSVRRIMCSDEFNTCKDSCVIFLHLQKTAGTSLREMLRETYGPALFEEYTEPRDVLHKLSPVVLYRYTLFSGHFNHDSMAHIPHKQKFVFTFLREPKKRLLSLYYYWRAYLNTDDLTLHPGAELANELTAEEFFGHAALKKEAKLWNHLTWGVMGERKWKEWRALLAEMDDKAIKTFMEKTVRPAVRERLREFIFVGLQEDFERSVKMLYRVLGVERPEKIVAENVLEDLIKSNPDFKKSIDKKQPMTPRLESELDRLVHLDNIVYEEGKAIFAEQLKKYPGIRKSPVIATSAGMDKYDEKTPIILDCPYSGAPLVIAFGGIAGGLAMPPFEFFNTIMDLEANKIFIRDLKQSWYHAGLPALGNNIGEIASFLRHQIKNLDAVRTVFIGNSMGGYAAILFGALLGVDTVHAFAPQTFIDETNRAMRRDGRWAEQIGEAQRAGAEIYFDLRTALGLNGAAKSEVNIYYSPHDELDTAHAKHLSGVENVKIHLVEAGGHALVKHLKDTGLLKKIIADSLINKCE